jgi:hypothetical protein
MSKLKESAVAGVGKEVKKVTATTMAAEGQPFSGVKVGPVQRRFFMLRLRARMVPAIAAALSLNRTDAVALFEETYGFDDVMYACNTRANAVEYKLTAIGDGQIFGQLLKFGESIDEYFLHDFWILPGILEAQHRSVGSEDVNALPSCSIIPFTTGS